MGIANSRSASIELEFASTVPAGMRGAVEELFFFNPRQQALGPAIRRAIERFGVPEIQEQEGRLWIRSTRCPMQCLFAHQSKHRREHPVGVVLYTRLRHDTLTATHLAVDPAGNSLGELWVDDLGIALIGEVRRIASRINGVSRVELPYRESMYLPVR